MQEQAFFPERVLPAAAPLQVLPSLLPAPRMTLPLQELLPRAPRTPLPLREPLLRAPRMTLLLRAPRTPLPLQEPLLRAPRTVLLLQEPLLQDPRTPLPLQALLLRAPRTAPPLQALLLRAPRTVLLLQEPSSKLLPLLQAALPSPEKPVLQPLRVQRSAFLPARPDNSLPAAAHPPALHILLPAALPRVQAAPDEPLPGGSLRNSIVLSRCHPYLLFRGVCIPWYPRPALKQGQFLLPLSAEFHPRGILPDSAEHRPHGALPDSAVYPPRGMPGAPALSAGPDPRRAVLQALRPTHGTCRCAPACAVLQRPSQCPPEDRALLSHQNPASENLCLPEFSVHASHHLLCGYRSESSPTPPSLH